MTPFTWNIQSREIGWNKAQIGGGPGLGEGRVWGGGCRTGTEFPVWGDEHLLELDCEIPLNCSLYNE